ncbi:hypothetical protein [Hornefia butyriciproducens]|uniref:Pyridoxamine 5'-phosphate oxidase putative domain-containing protein n=1 Tax=Hornefia butyriciproducens TaxID=2652293 RepID=A0A6L5Y391_9FIRM|nr:hypothetical protein [Hornefia butyriciproducens]MST51073.1 hypothetical protein [Hornefia butyriciproducens]
MDTSKILSILYSEIHSVVVGMIDSEGHPSSAFLDVMFAEEDAVYFMTSDNGRKLYHLLNGSDYISICGKTEGDFFHAKMITIQGRVRNIGKARVDELIDANPYMKKLYPDEQKEKRRIIDVFQVYEGYGNYQDFGVTPPKQTEFQFHCEIE